MASHVADAASRPPSWTTLRTPEVDDCCCGLGFAPSEEGSGRSQEDHEGCAQVAKGAPRSCLSYIGLMRTMARGSTRILVFCTCIGCICFKHMTLGEQTCHFERIVRIVPNHAKIER